MPDYPGVDPDGLTPGGLQIAGKVNAGALAVLGQSIVPDVFGWGTWSGDDGVNIPHGTNANLPFTSEDKAFTDIGFTSLGTTLTFREAGTYMAFAAVFINSGSPTTGIQQAVLVISAGVSWDERPKLPHDLMLEMTLYPWIICDVPADATIAISVYNSLDVDANFGGEIAIARLA